MTSVYTSSTGQSWVDDLAVQQTENGAILTPEAMDVDRPYPYRLGGEWLVAVRRSGGAIDVYALREPILERLRRWLRR